MKTRLIEYRENNSSTWTKKILDEKLNQDLLDFPLFKELPLAQKASAIILGYIPKCECGKELKFLGKNKNKINGTPFGGWLEFCSTKCSRSSQTLVTRRQNTNLERFGETSWAKTEEAKLISTELWSNEKKEKYNIANKKTCQEKYGVDHFSKTEEYLEKREATILEATGGKYTNYFQDIELIQSGNLQKYGVSSWAKTDEAREHMSSNCPMYNSETVLKVRLSSLSKTHSVELTQIILKEDPIGFKGFVDNIALSNSLTHRRQIADSLNISYTYLNALFRRFNMDNDYLTLGTSTSYKEFEVLEYVKSLGVNPKHGDRTILEGREIDILIESHKLGIEFDGLYYHSVNSGGKDKHYHVSKTNMAESKGYQLLHIFENEWDDKHKQIIWKSIIKSKLGIFDKKIFARKCKVKELSSNESRAFFDSNHLSGFIGASTHLGLFYEDILVSAISYGKSRFCKSENEIYRFASLLDNQVLGALGKLLSKLPKDNLVSYADRRISGTNSAYAKFFSNKKTLPPTWWGNINHSGDLKHRLSFTKSKIKDLLGDNYDDSKSAMYNMFDNKIDIIYDCGNWKFYN